MCDYSLLGIPNRLAVEGEPLVIHRFQTGAMGLASAAEIAAPATEPHEPTRRQGWWSALKTYFMPSAAKLSARSASRPALDCCCKTFRPACNANARLAQPRESRARTLRSTHATATTLDPGDAPASR